MTRRTLLALLLAASHIGIIVALLVQPTVVLDKSTASAMVVMAIPAPAAVIETAPPPITTEILSRVDPPEFLVASAEAATASGACDLAASIEAALRRDKSVSLAVAQIPVGARSVSNSLLLWDGDWARAASVGGNAALEPIRAIVAAQVRAASADCRNEVVVGPRLVIIPERSGQIVLAFGSGQWSWQRLL